MTRNLMANAETDLQKRIDGEHTKRD